MNQYLPKDERREMWISLYMGGMLALVLQGSELLTNVKRVIGYAAKPLWAWTSLASMVEFCPSIIDLHDPWGQGSGKPSDSRPV